jgi:hypothetical protein
MIAVGGRRALVVAVAALGILAGTQPAGASAQAKSGSVVTTADGAVRGTSRTN